MPRSVSGRFVVVGPFLAAFGGNGVADEIELAGLPSVRPPTPRALARRCPRPSTGRTSRAALAATAMYWPCSCRHSVSSRRTSRSRSADTRRLARRASPGLPRVRAMSTSRSCMRPSRSCACFSVRIRAAFARRRCAMQTSPSTHLQRVAQLLHRDAHLVQAIGQVDAGGVLDGRRADDGTARGALPARARQLLRDRAARLPSTCLARDRRRRASRSLSRSKPSMRSRHIGRAAARVPRRPTCAERGRSPARGTSPTPLELVER